MTTVPFIDFLAPIPALPAFDETHLPRQPLSTPVPEFISPKQLRIYQLSQLDRADFFTYLIMGLAALIAVIVPLLNLS